MKRMIPFLGCLSVAIFTFFNVDAQNTGWSSPAAAPPYGVFSFGGTATGSIEVGRNVCTDAAGNYYVVGDFGNGADFDPSAGVNAPTVPNPSGNFASDMFVAKYNSSGQVQWVAHGGVIASTDNNTGNIGNICTNGTNVYITGAVTIGLPASVNNAGTFTSANGTTCGTCTVPSSTTSTLGMGYVAKLDAATGTFQWVKYWGTNASQSQGQGICLDPSENVYINGQCSGIINVVPATAFTTTTAECFFAKLDATGAWQWATHGGGSTGNGGDGAGTSGGGICYNANLSRLTATGCYNSTDATFGSFALASNTASDNNLYVAELNPSTGAFLYATGFGSTGSDDGVCCYDPSTHDIFIAGLMSGNITLPGKGLLTQASAGTGDIFVARYTPNATPANGTFTWARSFGLAGTDRAWNVASDAAGNILVVGSYAGNNGTLNFGTGTTTQVTSTNANNEGFVASLSAATGAGNWAAQCSGTATNGNVIKGIVALQNASGIAYATGNIGFTTVSCTPSSLGNAISVTNPGPGTSDIFIGKLFAANPAIVTNVTVPANGTYKIGDQLNFTVNWNTNVTITGTPYIPVTIGSTTVQANYVSGSGTAALVFRYTVVSGDLDNDGIAVGSSITLNGGTIKNGTITSNSALNSIGSTTAVLVDGIAPTVTSITLLGTSPTNATVVQFLVTFSEAVTGGGTSNFSLTSTTSGPAIGGISGTGTTRTVTANTGSGNGTIRLDMANSSAVTDVAGNPVSGLAYTSGAVYTIYKTTNTLDYFRTKNVTGNWGTATDWESSADNSYFITATQAPTNAANTSTVQSGHTIAVSSNQSAGNITLSGNIAISNATLSVTGSFTGAGSSNYVQTNSTGILKLTIGNGATKSFPVGNSTYNPLSLTNNSGAGDDFAVKVLDEVYQNGVSGTVVAGPHVKRTWDITKTNANAGSGINLLFNWSSGQTTGTITTAKMFHHNGVTWIQQTGTTVATSTTLTYTGYIGTFSPFSVGDNITALPLTLLSFKAIKDVSDAVLTWQTANESGTQVFEIERSSDGTTFAKVGTAKPLSSRSYNYTDKLNAALFTSAKVLYYRLRIVDKDGAFTYSPITYISNDQKDLIYLYPNPLKQTLNIALANGNAYKSLKIFDNAGKLVYQTKAYTTTVRTDRFSSGVYYIEVEMGDGSVLKRSIVKE